MDRLKNYPLYPQTTFAFATEFIDIKTLHKLNASAIKQLEVSHC